ncbi:energy transducer TonB [uncultured Duncaniella sp.]|jgi:hypothetical protein|uniref:energy transducer TonB n=2 Tax=Duncaniella TaxID=2518495 RepID=UPI0025AF93D1|nr:energy transducer TonB [uncultured Duncaniella sp.]
MKNIITALISLIITFNLSAQTGRQWLAAARQGKIEAMQQTAIRYLNGFDGLPRDKAKALYWAQKGAEMGNVDAMLLTATIYQDQTDNLMSSKTIYWYEKAAQAGSKKGMESLCRTYSSIFYPLSNNKPEQIKCTERLIYWYNQMSQSYSYTENERQSFARMKRNFESELSKLNGETADHVAATVAKEEPEEIVAPQFPGGAEAMRQFINKNLNKTLGDRFEKHGTVVVSFIVYDNGTIDNIESTHLHSNLDTEARRIVKIMPRWIPGTKGGRPTPMKQSISIGF